MKILVDEMPVSNDDCPFAGWENTKWKNYCKLGADGVSDCNLENGECAYLKVLENNCETCRHWWKSEEVCLLDNCHYEPETEPQTIPIKKTITGSKGERIEYSEAEMIVRDDERSDANDSRRTDQKTE